jgi:crotonobetainyl-CoA:carnitine CoA-transferase CaiB-like acyl-CoA transferase
LLLLPHLPRTCLADLAGAQQVVSTALALILGRERGQGSAYAEVSLAEAAEWFAEPWRQGLTTPGGVLGGGRPGYRLYPAKVGWIAVAALEPHFERRLVEALQLTAADEDQFRRLFLTRTAEEWEEWAAQYDVPIAAVRD